MSPTRKRTVMTDEHKAALAAGRSSGASVRRYLDALETSRPRRGRRVAPETLAKQLLEIDKKLDGADPLKRLHLVQERKSIEGRLAAQDDGQSVQNFEAEFVLVAREYGERKGISYSTWREVGVPAEVLKRAGIDR